MSLCVSAAFLATTTCLNPRSYKKSVVIRRGCVQLHMHYEHVQVCEDGTEKRVRCVRHGGAFKRHSSRNSSEGFTNKGK